MKQTHTFIALLVLLAVLQVTDVVTTFADLAAGGAEWNPLMGAWLQSGAVLAYLEYKLLSVAVFIAAALAAYALPTKLLKGRGQRPLRVLAFALMLLVASALTVTVVWNVHVLWLLLAHS